MISDKIKALRIQTGLTQTQLAKKLNITRSSVNAWEMGISTPSTQLVVDLSKIFKVSTDYLLETSSNLNINLDSLTEEQSRIILSLLHYFNKENESNK